MIKTSVSYQTLIANRRCSEHFQNTFRTALCPRAPSCVRLKTIGNLLVLDYIWTGFSEQWISTSWTVHITHWARIIHSVHQAWRLWRWIVENDEWESKRSLQDKLNRWWDGRSQGKLKLKNRFDRTKHNVVCVEAGRRKATRNAVSIAVELESGEKDKHRKLSTEPPSQTPQFDSCLHTCIKLSLLIDVTALIHVTRLRPFFTLFYVH